tara:strand:- start:138 stop:554 length:417 start_codon:yes stop_codon:yes gene_type:complete
MHSELELKNVNIEENNNFLKKSLNVIKEKISVVDIRASTIHLIIKYVIEELDNSELKGTEKKEMALKLIKEIIKDLTEGEDEKKLLSMLEDGTVSNLIDLIIDATKGKINVNVIAETSISCIAKCLPICFPSLKKKLK